MKIHIRKARPDDFEPAFPMIYASGPHEFDYIFNVGNKTTQSYLSFAFRTKWGTQSHRVFTVSTVDSQVVGIYAFYTGRDLPRLNLGNIWNVLRFYGPLGLMKLARKSANLETVIPPPEAEGGFISQFAVKEEFRGCGIGTALMNHQIDLARKMGIHRCMLDVAVTNPGAQKLYERLGFNVVQEHRWKFPDSKMHVPGQRRMELAL